MADPTLSSLLRGVYGQGYDNGLMPGNQNALWDWQREPVTTADVNDRVQHNGTWYGQFGNAVDSAQHWWDEQKDKYLPDAVRNPTPLPTVNHLTSFLDVPSMAIQAAGSANRWLNLDPHLDEGDLLALPGGMVGLNAVAGGMQPGAAGVFGGRLAKTADHAKLATAERMAAEGAPREAIWNETGWFQGADKKWRFEIDDSKTAIGRPGPKYEPFDDYWYGQSASGNFGDILKDRSGLRSAYPSIDAENTIITKGGNSGERGFGRIIANAEDSADLRSILLHEKQHGIQDVEKFGRGGSSRQFTPDEIAAERSRLMAVPEGNGWDSVNTFSGDTSDKAIANDLYRRLSGEAEARTVQKRMDLTPEQRAARPPWLDYDVPESQQIVRMPNALLSDTSRSSLPGTILNGAEHDRPGIVAYHGSPHDFDKFDMSKIGTGEGAQAYGHGIYLAENEDVAKAYKTAGPAGSAHYGRVNSRMSELAREMGKLEKPGQYRKYTDQAKGDALAAEYDALMSEKLGNKLGNMYQVRINADPEHFLDWDKPLSKQSEVVRNAWDEFKDSHPDYNDPAKVGGQYREPTGKEFYSAHFEHVPGFGEKARALASSPLREAGIPGIKYLDQGSRAAGEGSRNYVVFDDKTIEILKKYGLLGTLGMGGASLSPFDIYGTQNE